MGINFTCAISNISIQEGDEIRFIPLQQKYIHKKQNVLKPRIGFHSINEIFNPFAFPIKGVVADFLRVTNIEKTFNTKVIEDFFGISVEKFIECIKCDRGINDYNGEIFNNYAIEKEPFSNRFSTDLDSALKKLGFQKETHTFETNLTLDGFTHSNLPKGIFIVLNKYMKDKKGYSLENKSIQAISKVEKNDNTYTIFDLTEEKVIFSSHASYLLEELLNKIYYVTNVHVNFHKEDYAKIHQLLKLSGTIILEEVYQALIEPNEDLEHWRWSSIVNQVEADKKKIHEDLKEMNDLIARKEAGENIDPFDIECANPLSTFNIGDFYSFEDIVKWNSPFFKKNYAKYVPTDEFFNAVLDFERLEHSMSSLGKMFFPSLIQGDGGSYYAARVLAQKTLDIASQRIARNNE